MDWLVGRGNARRAVRWHIAVGYISDKVGRRKMFLIDIIAMA